MISPEQMNKKPNRNADLIVPSFTFYPDVLHPSHDRTGTQEASVCCINRGTLRSVVPRPHRFTPAARRHGFPRSVSCNVCRRLATPLDIRRAGWRSDFNLLLQSSSQTRTIVGMLQGHNLLFLSNSRVQKMFLVSHQLFKCPT